jgi:hypothetical protein
MALVTTFMTGPALDFINWIFKSQNEEILNEISQVSKYKILISFGHPERGASLLRLANGFIRKQNENSSITALHLSPANELNHYNMEQYEKESFAPIVQQSKELNQKITTLFKPSGDFDSDIAEVANKGAYDLLLVGVGQSIFEGSLLGKFLGFTTKIINPEKLLNQVKGKNSLFENSPFDERTKLILSKTEISVGISVDKGFKKVEQVFIPILDEKDIFLIKFAQKLINNASSQITVFDAVGKVKNNPQLKEIIRAIEQNAPNHIALIGENAVEKDFLSQKDLMLVSIESWKKLIDNKTLWLSDIPSALILADRS